MKLYNLGRHRLLCGDCANEEHVKMLMQGKKGQMIFTDPPWNVGYTGRRKPREGLINDDISQEEYEIMLKMALNNLSKSVEAGASTYIVMSTSQWSLLNKLMEDKYRGSSVIIWDKMQFVVSWSDYHRQYEPIWYGWTKAQKRLHPLKLRNQSDIWKIKKPRVNKLHPTQKPVELIEKAVLNSTNEGDIVLDFFGGSGSTLIACEKTNRTCYMIEIDKTHCANIVKRYEEYVTEMGTN